MEINGEIRTANESLARALLELKKDWEGSEIRLSLEEVSNKHNALKEIVNLSIELASYYAKFEMIS